MSHQSVNLHRYRRSAFFPAFFTVIMLVFVLFLAV